MKRPVVIVENIQLDPVQIQHAERIAKHQFHCFAAITAPLVLFLADVHADIGISVGAVYILKGDIADHFIRSIKDNQ
ncbi:Uncharacterised protein [Mycobacteroides abscessus subsp. abscessus]|nr:Uncharacterised protein [Mycobacteroides abscessus subsp. abscessus]